MLLLFLLYQSVFAGTLFAGSGETANYTSAWKSQENDTIQPTSLGFSRASSIVLESRLFVVGGEEASTNISITSAIGLVKSSSRMRVFDIKNSTWTKEAIVVPLPLVEPKLATTDSTVWVVGGLQIEGGFASETNRVFAYQNSSWIEGPPFKQNYSSYGYTVCSSQDILYLFDGISIQSLDAESLTAEWVDVGIPPFPTKQLYRVSSVCDDEYGYYADHSEFTGFWRLDIKERLVASCLMPHREWTFINVVVQPEELTSFESMQSYGKDTILVFTGRSLFAFNISSRSFEHLVKLDERLRWIAVAASVDHERVFFSGGLRIEFGDQRSESPSPPGVFMRNRFGVLKLTRSRTSIWERLKGLMAS